MQKSMTDINAAKRLPQPLASQSLFLFKTTGGRMLPISLAGVADVLPPVTS
jgi:hypothetical protein